MFTGIIEEIGSVKQIQPGAQSMTVTIAASLVLTDVRVGDSIAVNGVCLTVKSFTKDQFVADVMPETVTSTSLRQLEVGSSVNLERALAANGRLGGHFVTGHVDGIATIREKRTVDNALYIRLSLPQGYHPYLLHKGSIALDGTSLTIFEVKDTDITISLIPHSQEMTVIAKKQIGDVVNFECDMLAKYVENMLQKRQNTDQTMSKDFLQQHGFM
ncbi:riboflavin synthase [Sporosarcina sp. P21c]|uniref:riboflavin synthase n=1 Tax=unclassified Sporosarcina TaxID=2647733 RepID=UPI000C16CCB4|nr:MULTISPECIES: riboflavin synthase [unclassified Sporosarcina]PIC67049.1 riboflavin synthase [Sporosarcina sp. P16a]PIC83390.1 riboflavin synthase [Sporosarcina sp. P1]PIC89774.1 riboflavin synthase [Sporosarcina sp. P21c]PIC92503.1 riboflavin synthase [Sporosarcina sp. P25]